jgi:hypothetical protein
VERRNVALAPFPMRSFVGVDEGGNPSCPPEPTTRGMAAGDLADDWHLLHALRARRMEADTGVDDVVPNGVDSNRHDLVPVGWRDGKRIGFENASRVLRASLQGEHDQAHLRIPSRPLWCMNISPVVSTSSAPLISGPGGRPASRAPSSG